MDFGLVIAGRVRMEIDAPKGTEVTLEHCTAFFTRWLYNMTCDQDQYGIVPMVIPQVGSYPMMGKFIHLTKEG